MVGEIRKMYKVVISRNCKRLIFFSFFFPPP